MATPIRVVVGDDHALVRRGILATLARRARLQVVAEGEAGADVERLVAEHRPDVLLTDLNMPQHADQPRGPIFQFVPALSRLIGRFPETAVAVLTQDDSVYTIQALMNVGVKGYVLKSDDFTEVLDRVIEMVAGGNVYFSPAALAAIQRRPRRRPGDLTEREIEIVRLVVLAPGLTRAALAARLGISESTLKTHISAIYRKLDAPNMESVIVMAIRMGLVEITELTP